MVKRAIDWQKIVTAEAGTCYWLAPDASRHPDTGDENANVRRELLNMRTISSSRSPNDQAMHDLEDHLG